MRHREQLPRRCPPAFRAWRIVLERRHRPELRESAAIPAFIVIQRHLTNPAKAAGPRRPLETPPARRRPD
jgi:hypothetical protein